jgi:MFS family permease
MTTHNLKTKKHVIRLEAANENIPQQLSKTVPWLIWSCAGLFYLYEMILRASPSVMTTELMHDFAVSSTALGVLSSFYYYAYVVLQVPCGLIVDRLGTRKVVTISTLLCVLGSVLFALSPSLPLAQLGRLLIGAGSACAFISCLKISSDWFLPTQFAIIAGLTNMMGTLGGMFSGPPFALLVNNFGWRQATMIAAFVGLIIALLSWVIIRERPHNTSEGHSHLSTQTFMTQLSHVAKSPQNWIFGIFGGLMYVPISAFCELWAVPFLMEIYSVNNEVASMASVMLYLGIALGSPFAAKLSDYLHSRLKVMFLSALVATTIFIMIVNIPNLPLTGMFLLLLFAGMANSGQVLSFACVKESVPNHLSGTAMGFTNALVMLSGIIFQPLLGQLLDFAWTGTYHADGTRLYDASAYKIAILAVPVCLALSMLLLKFARETFHKPQAS